MKKKKEKEEAKKEIIGIATHRRKVLTSGKVVENQYNKQEWMWSRNKYKNDKYGHIEDEKKYKLKILLMHSERMEICNMKVVKTKNHKNMMTT